MKKLLLSMVGLLMAVTPALAKDYSLTLNADTEYSAYPNNYTSSYTTTTVDGTYNFVNFNNGDSKNHLACLRAGRKGNASVATVGTDFQIPAKVTSVKVNIETLTEANASKVTITLEKSLDKETWTAVGTFTSAQGTQTVDIAAADQVENYYYQVKFDCQSASANGFVRIDALTITALDGGASKDPAGLSFGDTKSYRVVKGEDFTAPALINPNNLTVTWTSSDEAVATVDAEGALSILAPGKTTIKAASEATDKYFAGSASYELTVVGKAATIADLVANFTEKGDEAYVACPAVVAYVNGRNCYVKAIDGNAATQIYQETEYKLGDVIPAGWYATASPYSGLLEYTAEGLQPSTETKEVVYEKVAAVTGADINRVVVLTGVNFAEDTPDRTADKGSKAANFNGTLADGSTLVFRTNFPVESVKAGAYEVTGAVAFYIPKEGDGYLQFYPISYKLDDNTGVAGIEAESEAVYYDLQGNRVAEPETGVYIKVAGGRASKVLF